MFSTEYTILDFKNFVEKCFVFGVAALLVKVVDYAAEKPFILAVPHRVLIGRPEQLPAENPATPTPPLRSRRPRRLPF
jgi:hypothetical protein